MDSHHHDIVRLAWSRRLGLPDAALKPGIRYLQVDPDATEIAFLRLGDASALVGPEQLLEAARHRSDEELADRGTLSLLESSVSGRSRGPIVLSYAADIGTTIDLHDPLISHDLGHVLALDALCAPDDVLSADLTRKRSWFTLLSDDRPAESAAPLSCAAYLEWEGILADVGVLTAPLARRRGNAQVVARLATNDAIDEGLIPQWQTSAENGTARRLGSRLGYEEWGVFTSVELVTT